MTAQIKCEVKAQNLGDGHSDRVHTPRQKKQLIVEVFRAWIYFEAKYAAVRLSLFL